MKYYLSNIYLFVYVKAVNAAQSLLYLLIPWNQPTYVYAAPPALCQSSSDLQVIPP